MSWVDHILAPHLQVTDAIRHSEYMESDRYFVWQEDGENNLTAGGIRKERAVTGTTDLFTKQEFDPWKEELEKAFDASPYVCWKLNSVQFEEETGFYHYEWRWEVLG